MPESRVRSCLPLLLFLSGCFLVTAVDCDHIGCLRGLVLEFTDPIDVPFRLELVSLDSPADSRLVICNEPLLCGEGAVLSDWFPDSVRLTLMTATDTLQRVLQPNYRIPPAIRRSCGSECLVANAEVDWSDQLDLVAQRY